MVRVHGNHYDLSRIHDETSAKHHMHAGTPDHINPMMVFLLSAAVLLVVIICVLFAWKGHSRNADAERERLNADEGGNYAACTSASNAASVQVYDMAKDDATSTVYDNDMRQSVARGGSDRTTLTWGAAEPMRFGNSFYGEEYAAAARDEALAAARDANNIETNRGMYRPAFTHSSIYARTTETGTLRAGDKSTVGFGAAPSGQQGGDGFFDIRTGAVPIRENSDAVATRGSGDIATLPTAETGGTALFRGSSTEPEVDAATGSSGRSAEAGTGAALTGATGRGVDATSSCRSAESGTGAAFHVQSSSSQLTVDVSNPVDRAPGDKFWTKKKWPQSNLEAPTTTDKHVFVGSLATGYISKVPVRSPRAPVRARTHSHLESAEGEAKFEFSRSLSSSFASPRSPDEPKEPNETS